MVFVADGFTHYLQNCNPWMNDIFHLSQTDSNNTQENLPLWTLQDFKIGKPLGRGKLSCRGLIESEIAFRREGQRFPCVCCKWMVYLLVCFCLFLGDGSYVVIRNRWWYCLGDIPVGWDTCTFFLSMAFIGWDRAICIFCTTKKDVRPFLLLYV